MIRPSFEKPPPGATGPVNLQHSFEQWVLPVLGDNPKILEALNFWGMAVLIISVCSIIYSTRTGRSQGLLKPLMGAALLGTLLVAPGVLLPIVLGVFDAALNALLGFLSSFAKE